MKKFYVTTPIYYPNDILHIGHAYTTVLADYISRYKKLKGYDVFFLTGSDEHGQKIEDRAKVAEEDTLEFVTKIVDSFKNLWSLLGIEYDQFIRTTDTQHKDFVKSSFDKLKEKGFIYKGQYNGWYCKPDESFFTKTQIKENNLCPVCSRELIKINEESYFLKISDFKEWIEFQLLNNDILIPNNRVKELINSFINDLQDLSITRTSFLWGIKVPNDPKHVIYVWLDALLNYISAFSYENNKWSIEEVWSPNSKTEIVHLVGKEITRFHSIYLPIILKMLNYKLSKVIAHGWIVSDDGKKMSKSLQNSINPVDLIKKYGKDAIRFYLINNISTGEDGKFSESLLTETINGILVNKFSNLISRTQKMIENSFEGIVPKRVITNEKIDFFVRLESIFKTFVNKIDNFEFSNSSKVAIQYIEEINKYIDETTPWKETDKEKLGTTLNYLITAIFNSSIILSPILLDSTKKIFDWLNFENPSFKDMDKDFSGHNLRKINYLFERIK